MCQLEEGIFHLQLVLHHGLLDIVEVLSVGGGEVDGSVAEERRRLGECVHKVSKVAEVLNNLRQRSGLARARAAGQGDTGDILIHRS